MVPLSAAAIVLVNGCVTRSEIVGLNTSAGSPCSRR